MIFWNRTLALLCALTLSVAAAPAVQASDEGPFYVSVSGMWVIPGDIDSSGTIADPNGGTADLTGRSKIELEDSFGFAAAFGYGELTGLRGEVEIGYRSLDLDKVTTTASIAGHPDARSVRVTPNPDLDLDTWSVMANAIYAFDGTRFRPYVGAGIGLAEHDISSVAQTATVDLDGDTTTTDDQEDYRSTGGSDDDTVFAWQLMVGVGYAVSDSTEVRLGYRYFDTADADFVGLDVNYDSHNVELGIVHCF